MQNNSLTIAILTWNAPRTLENTLKSYDNSGLLEYADERLIFLQENNQKELELAKKYDFKILSSETNIGIGEAYKKMLESATSEYFLFLENDWFCVEGKKLVISRLNIAKEFLKANTADCVRLRHKKNYGEPLHSKNAFQGKELTGITHLLDCIHWIEDPSEKYGDYIKKIIIGGESWFLAPSAYANYTNNPCMYKTSFVKQVLNADFKSKQSQEYLKQQTEYASSKGVSPESVALEFDITKWWSMQNFYVVQGIGLFKHNPLLEQQKIKLALIKYNGLKAGGTERWLQNVAANLDKEKFEVDYFHTGDADKNRENFLLAHNVNLIKIKANGKESAYGKWLETDFFEKFDEKKYDLIQSAIAGEKEWPFYTFKKPVIHSIHLDYGADKSPNVFHQFFLSSWLRDKNAKLGGIKALSSLAPIGCELPSTDENLRNELSIPADVIVAGYHQRVDDNTYSDIPLNAYAKIQNASTCFILLGGSLKYTEQAHKLGIKNFIQLEHNSSKEYISKFLNTLDIFAHGRRDGETFGYVFAEALLHKLPCIGHKTVTSNAHKETMGVGGLFAENQEDYTNKLRLLFSNKELRQELSQKGYVYAKEQFIDRNYYKEIEDKYLEIISNLSKYKKKMKLLNIGKKIKMFKFFKKEKTSTHRIYTIVGFKIKTKRKKSL